MDIESHNQSPRDVAKKLGFPDVVSLLDMHKYKNSIKRQAELEIARSGKYEFDIIDGDIGIISQKKRGK